MEVTLVPYKKINKQNWDLCIANALHPSLFCTSKYLDNVAIHWDALILNDYEIVMPLIFRKKLGIAYLYQPAFLPHISIFSSSKISQSIIKAFVDKAFELYNFAEISLAHPITAPPFHKNMVVRDRNNFVVNLKKDYKSIYNSYHPHFTKSLRRLQKLSLQYKISNDVKEIITLYELLYLKRIKSVEKKDVQGFLKLCLTMQKDNNTVIRKVQDENGNLLAAVILLQYKNILYNIISCITPLGKKSEANYFLYDKIMEEFSGGNNILDLEGSDIKGVANFYLKMNPTNEKYIFIKYNNLPKLIKLIKK
jgi:hypothetical protein